MRDLFWAFGIIVLAVVVGGAPLVFFPHSFIVPVEPTGNIVAVSNLASLPIPEVPFVVDENLSLESGRTVAFFAGYYNDGAKDVTIVLGDQSEGDEGLRTIICGNEEREYTMKLVSPQAVVKPGKTVALQATLVDFKGIASTTLSCALPIYDVESGFLVATSTIEVIITA